MEASLESELKELAFRANDGLEVTLLWRKTDDSLKVAVVDTNTEGRFTLPVEDDGPLDVFHHPFAYAAFRTPDSGCGS